MSKEKEDSIHKQSFNSSIKSFYEGDDQISADSTNLFEQIFDQIEDVDIKTDLLNSAKDLSVAVLADGTASKEKKDSATNVLYLILARRRATEEQVARRRESQGWMGGRRRRRRSVKRRRGRSSSRRRRSSRRRSRR